MSADESWKEGGAEFSREQTQKVPLEPGESGTAVRERRRSRTSASAVCARPRPVPSVFVSFGAPVPMMDGAEQPVRAADDHSRKATDPLSISNMNSPPPLPIQLSRFLRSCFLAQRGGGAFNAKPTPPRSLPHPTRRTSRKMLRIFFLSRVEAIIDRGLESPIAPPSGGRKVECWKPGSSGVKLDKSVRLAGSTALCSSSGRHHSTSAFPIR